MSARRGSRPVPSAYFKAASATSSNFSGLVGICCGAALTWYSSGEGCSAMGSCNAQLLDSLGLRRFGRGFKVDRDQLHPRLHRR